MEITESNFKANEPVTIDEEIKSYLLETAMWAKFLSIMGFVGIGLMVLIAFAMLMLGSFFGNFVGGTVSAGMLAVIYIVMAILYFFPVYYLFKFSTDTKHGLTFGNQNVLATGFENLKSHYKFVGILMIVVLSMYALILLFGLLAITMR